MEEINTNNKKYIIEYNNLMEEWDWEKNSELGFYPDKISYGSTKQVWWKCNKGHEWHTTPNSRTDIGHPHGCPYCANKKVLRGYNDLLTMAPELCEEWNYQRNSGLEPIDILYGSYKKVWWKCKSCGYEWEATVDNRKHGTGCPICAKRIRAENARYTRLKSRGSLEERCPELLTEWDYDKNQISPSEITYGSRKKVNWKCFIGHTWEDSVQHRTIGKRGCPICSSESKTSFPEQAILYYFLKKTKALNREIVYGKEIDIYLPKLNVGIEYNSSYWHRDKVEKDKGKNKTLQENGITLFSVSDGRENKIDDNHIIYNKDLSFAIISLFNLIGISPPNIDIDRDRIYIYEQYVQIKKANSLAVKKPELAEEWNPTKNGNLTPDMFDYSSNKIVWWKCKKCGREWEQKINARSSKNYQCKICARKEAIGRNLGKKHYAAKPIVQCDKNNNIIKIWDCAADIERSLKINHSNIAACCASKAKSANGYLWYYLYDNTLKNGKVVKGALTIGIVSDDCINSYLGGDIDEI